MPIQSNLFRLKKWKRALFVRFHLLWRHRNNFYSGECNKYTLPWTIFLLFEQLNTFKYFKYLCVFQWIYQEFCVLHGVINGEREMNHLIVGTHQNKSWFQRQIYKIRTQICFEQPWRELNLKNWVCHPFIQHKFSTIAFMDLRTKVRLYYWLPK